MLDAKESIPSFSLEIYPPHTHFFPYLTVLFHIQIIILFSSFTFYEQNELLQMEYFHASSKKKNNRKTNLISRKWTKRERHIQRSCRLKIKEVKRMTTTERNSIGVSFILHKAKKKTPFCLPPHFYSIIHKLAFCCFCLQRKFNQSLEDFLKYYFQFLS